MPPSPTGKLHLGTARTALFNWLFWKNAEKSKAMGSSKMVFRWEDTDRERSKAEFEEEILNGLAWLGMNFEKESHVFCRQTDRTDIHKEYLQKLWEAEKVFPCFTTKEELDDLREKANNEKTNFVFWSPSRNESREVLTERMKNEPFVWRLRVNREACIAFDDAVRGKVITSASTLGDFVVARADGSVLYLLANVVDDSTQGITHVIRGEDHISNTPKQVLLYEALGFALPTFAHIPLVLNKQKKKLSKRNVDPDVAVLVEDFRRMGFLPQAVVNGLALTGWKPDSQHEIFDFKELIEQFSLKRVQKAAAQYDFDKMKWLNREWMKKIDEDALENAYKAWAKNQNQEDFINEPGFATALHIFKHKAYTFSALPAEFASVFAPPAVSVSVLDLLKDQAQAKAMLGLVLDFLEDLEIKTDDLNPESMRDAAKAFIKEKELKTGAFLNPFRIALTRISPSAGPFEVVPVIGIEKAKKRAKELLDQL